MNLLMRRHFLLNEPTGCLLHLPLAFSGDLSDRITGNSLELSGNGSLTWDATKGMYKVVNPTTLNQWVARIQLDLSASRFPTDSFTTIGQVKRITTTALYASFMANSTTEGSSDATLCNYNSSIKLSEFPNTLAKVAAVINHTASNRSYYQNGTKHNTYAENTALLPSTLNLGSSAYLYIGFTRSSNFFGAQYYVADYWLFNRALSANEIYQIQGY